MKKCIFIGPTMAELPKVAGIDFFWPASLGSIYRAVGQGYDIIGIVDGVFGNVPSVWHKEILYALSQGCHVAGASSMGALRAAELHPYGMTGTGLIYRLYRCGLVEDDDELSLSHAEPKFNCAPLTFPMINMRLTLRQLVRKGFLQASRAQQLCENLKAVHFSYRDERKIGQIFENGEADPRLFAAHYVDQKKADARQLIDFIGKLNSARRSRTEFPETIFWRRQFVEELADIPPLEKR